jgi:hypothetical protein
LLHLQNASAGVPGLTRLGLGGWLLFAPQLGSHVDVTGLGVEGGIETCEPAAFVVLAAFADALLVALELALVAGAGSGELSLEAGQLRPAEYA